MVDINWDILAQGMRDQQRQWEQFGQNLKEARQQRDIGNALADYRANPSNTKALDFLYMNDPKLAGRVEDRTDKQQQRQALSALLDPAGGSSVPSAPALGIPAGAPVNDLMPKQTSAQTWGGQMGGGGMPAPRAPAQSGPDISMRNLAFRNLVALDLDQASKIATLFGNMDKATREREERKTAVTGSLAMHLKSVPQEQRQTELMRLAPQLYAQGFTPEDLETADLSDGGLQGYAALAMDVKTILGQQRADRRLEWDMEDDEIDNARADRSTDSLVASRNASSEQGWARVGISRESMERTDARGRRGQDIASSDRRRGQDISAETGRRGQDMADRRAREGVGRRGGAPRVPAGANVPLGSPLSPTNAPMVAPPPRQRQQPRPAPRQQQGAPRVAVNPKTGQKLQLVGGKWVPVR